MEAAKSSAGGVGSGNKVKAVNQLLACIHLAFAAEALAFAVKKGMDLDAVMAVILSGAAYSYVAKDRQSDINTSIQNLELMTRCAAYAHGERARLFRHGYLGERPRYCAGRGKKIQSALVPGWGCVPTIRSGHGERMGTGR